MAKDLGMASLLLNNAMDRRKGVVLIDTPGHNPAAKTITTAKGFKPMGSTVRMHKATTATSMDLPVSSLVESEVRATTP